MDDNFASITKAITWGRRVNDTVRKFLWFQASTNITAIVITFVSAISSNEEEPVLTAVQLLWVDIITDAFAAFALTTDPASKSLLDRKPDTRGMRLFTADTIKMTLEQSIYKIIIILEPGEIIPCDGIPIPGHNVRRDESGATGESDAVKKVDYNESLPRPNVYLLDIFD